MVELAIKRGVYFEIKYSGLIADAQARRLMLSDARLLVDWTRGKNLIISSSAISVNDIRGPYDVANLSSFLLGLSKERAKAAISRNCSSLITNALRKKDYKEAIRIERIASDDKLDSGSDWFGDWNDWDPISSGKGDLPPLDDISKLFSAVSKQPKSCPAIDFLSSDNTFSLKDHISSNGKGPIAVNERETNISCPKKPVSGTVAKLSSSADDVLVDNRKSVPVAPLGLKISGYEGSKVSLSSRLGVFADAEESTMAVTVSNNETVENSTENNGATDAAGIPCSDTQLKYCTFKGKDSLVSTDFFLANTSTIDEISTTCVEDVRTSDSPGIVSVTTVAPSDVTELVCKISNAADGHLSSNGKEAFSLKSLEKIIPEEQIEATGLEREPNDEVFSDNAPQKIDFLESDPSGGIDGQLSGAVPFVSELKTLEEEVLVDTDACMEEVLVKHEDHNQQEATSAYGYRLKSGKGKQKGRSCQSYPLPFKSPLKRKVFKRKSCQRRRSIRRCKDGF
ncbi:uncharacterized protein LOC109829935 [Asparagus officinalis]|uniref:uncharacterized protein LOC109829935 n=1 Tax=Asparagus officinalis TaxID=4686 RepID=UPI00098E281D|nr:uncharacterized protein LOC109829935 [Asparagus officinalis]